MTRARAGWLAVALAALATPVAAQRGDGITTIRVLAEADSTPLPNAEVIDLATGARALTRENGQAGVRLPSRGALDLRVRQLGFAFVDLSLNRADRAGREEEPVIVYLRRVAFALPALTTTAASDCPSVDPEMRPLAFWALEQLREGAERYESFRKAYPFNVRVERRTVQRVRADLPPRVRVETENGESGAWGDRYMPRGVVQLHGLGFSVPILFVATLGDRVFWDHHCVASARLDGDQVTGTVRLLFRPRPSARHSDWEGEAHMDAATSLLKRIDFRLDVRQKDGPRRLEGYTTFSSPSPLIAVPDSTLAMWWRSAPADSVLDWGMPHVVQLVRVLGIDYRKARPPTR